eukprot:65190-Prorocentrum_minimum.AAC.2
MSPSLLCSAPHHHVRDIPGEGTNQPRGKSIFLEREPINQEERAYTCARRRRSPSPPRTAPRPHTWGGAGRRCPCEGVKSQPEEVKSQPERRLLNTWGGAGRRCPCEGVKSHPEGVKSQPERWLLNTWGGAGRRCPCEGVKSQPEERGGREGAERGQRGVERG